MLSRMVQPWRLRTAINCTGRGITMSFCTAINCMDGRVQLPVIHYLQKRFGVDYVDVVTEPGPDATLARQTNRSAVESIWSRVDIAVQRHCSVGIAVVGHHDCAGNPSSKEQQAAQTRDAVEILRQRYREVTVIGLWVDEKWQVSEVR